MDASVEMKTVGKVVTTHLDIMSSDIKESLIGDDERNQTDTQITIDNKINENNEESAPNDNAMTFEEYRQNNISRSLNNDTKKGCCNCDWQFCLAETW